ncbi:putative quinol monooxygenase [Sphingomonas sp. ASY06-1R]|jgi:quinol monooxygenase YgiN|uniref:putative quinol monooxygenase n=1 Tax=Sphingomonas sp. ASY06-1R TaxID=3445771 RepID=UPI003FA2D47C
MIDRRMMMATSAAFAFVGRAKAEERMPMYGLIGQMKAVPGKRAALAGILLEGTETMPGCLSYIIAEDRVDADALWITEVWDSQQSHAASLKLPAVQAAITKGRPLIAGFGSRTETLPLGGSGLRES